MAPYGYRTGTCAECNGTATDMLHIDETYCDDTSGPHLCVVGPIEREPPPSAPDDGREVFFRGKHRQPPNHLYKTPKRVLSLHPRFYKPPTHQSQGQVEKEKRRARLHS